jgi:hypothetical protein
MKEIRISAKTLGEINMPDFCPRCWWIKQKCKQLPFQIFPGIFSSIDAYSKKFVHAYIDAMGHGPYSMGLEAVVNYLPIPHWSKYKRLDPNTGLTVSGVTDGRLEMKSGSLIIVDYKTSRLTANADKLMPIYEAQLNGYRWIEEGFGNTVHSTPLIYCEPYTEVDDFDSVCEHKGFSMSFHAKVVEVEHKMDLVQTLLEKARDIMDMETMPEGADGCKDCVKLQGLIELF